MVRKVCWLIDLFVIASIFFVAHPIGWGYVILSVLIVAHAMMHYFDGRFKKD